MLIYLGILSHLAYIESQNYIDIRDVAKFIRV
jgi:hypothetical protein